MVTLTKTALDALFSASFAPPSISERNGHSIRGDKLNQGWGTAKPGEPTYLYVTMLDINDEGKIVARKKEGDLGGATVRNKEMEFARVLAGGGGNPLDFTDFVFTKPTWFTIILNMDEWEFYYPQPNLENPTFKKDHDPLVFANDKVYFDANNNEVILPRSPNYSFYNCSQLFIVVPTDDGDKPRDAIRCINFFRKNEKGDPIEHEPDTQRYTFNIFVRAPLVENGKKVTIVIDPDGTNQGPIP
jgi:hypothetical protein